MPHPNQRATADLPPELRRTTVPPAVRDWVRRCAGAPVVGVRRLPGASSTAVHGLHLADGRRFVLRRYSWPGFLQEEPIAPRREVDALVLGTRSGLGVPEVVAADTTGDAVGDGVPVLLMSWLPGRAVGAPDVDRLAEVVASVHAVDASSLPHEYFRWYADRPTLRPPPSGVTAIWERAQEVWDAGPPPFRPAFVHRDFHPGNVLWSRGRLTGIVDWANACRGPTGCDIAHCRANLISWAGVAAADAFRAAYERLTGEAHHPYWEIASVFENGPSCYTRPAAVAEAEPRLSAALAELGALP
ncbi:MAG TPA: aminoglycoside phosphotransferase family protein [Acidimicrobiales bacterium]|nr:aminoglycoside phosphotransferase family protein [Acidimicrobiales bacterium]